MIWTWRASRYTKRMGKEYKYDELRPRIIKALKKLDDKYKMFGDDQKLIVVNSFLRIPLQDSIGGIVSGGESNLPAVALVDKDTGQIYYFALKALLPDLELG